MSDNEKETQVAEETQNTQAAAESNNEDRKSRRGQRGEGRRGERRNRREESHENEMLDRVVTINRVSKTHKGGRTFSFAALVVVGDGKGTVGVGYGKSREVPAAIAKGQLDAKKHMFTVPRIKGTVTHPVIGHDAAGTVLLRPAAPGTGVIAGGAVRAVMECAGITDVLDQVDGLRHRRQRGARNRRRPQEARRAGRDCRTSWHVSRRGGSGRAAACSRRRHRRGPQGS